MDGEENNFRYFRKPENYFGKSKNADFECKGFFLIILGRMYFGPIFFGKGKKVQVCSASGIVRLHY